MTKITLEQVRAAIFKQEAAQMGTRAWNELTQEMTAAIQQYADEHSMTYNSVIERAKL